MRDTKVIAPKYTRHPGTGGEADENEKVARRSSHKG